MVPHLIQQKNFCIKSAWDENQLWPVVQHGLSKEEKDSIITANIKKQTNQKIEEVLWSSTLVLDLGYYTL